MEMFTPKGNIYGPILPQFVLQKSITFGAKAMYALLCDYASETIAGLHRQRLPKDFHAASAASKTTLPSLSEKSSFL